MTKATQESALDFLVRVFDLRQKVLSASARAQSGLKYGTELVKSQCLQAIIIGLTNDNVRAEMRVHLQNINTSDELLLEKMPIAQGNESECMQTDRISRKFTPTWVNALQSEDNGDSGEEGAQAESPQNTVWKLEKYNPILSQIDASNEAIKRTDLSTSIISTVSAGPGWQFS